MTEAFIPDHELKLLRRLLADLPQLAVDLGDTRTKQARLGEVIRRRQQHRPSEQPLPVHLGAAAVADELRNELVGWVRLVCEQRAVVYEGLADTGSLARWLARHVYSLAITEGAGECYRELRAIADQAERIVCPPAVAIVVDDAKLTRARAMALSASGIATLAQELGEEYRNLTRRRVHVLKEAGEIDPVPGPWRPDWPMLFAVGEVLDSHLRVPIRDRHAKSCWRKTCGQATQGGR
ncbi:hypothetical protein ABZ412_34305 [Nocardia sp. NPDC005746]|uniref:hypothetical protein n=1 Tax=Nocardia sp. NPDC005746 TaxID=3157062 RepID=UPI0033D09D4A